MPLAGGAALSACAGPEVPVTTAAAPKKAVLTVNKASARDMDSARIAITVIVFLFAVGCRLRVAVCICIGSVDHGVRSCASDCYKRTRRT